MSQRLNDVIKHKQDNYIIPFLWLHGENETAIRTEISKIYECGISAFCVESRPHPDFVGNIWWRDMNVIIDEAKKHNMKIWILDDSHFPTGSAAGQAALCSAENRKTVLGFRWIDVVGPLNGSSFIPPYEVDIGKLKYVIAVNIENNQSCMNITKNFIDGRLYFDVPDGIWRIYYYYVNPDCIHSPHINHLRKGGAKVLLDAVYEPHFSHYEKEFGKTIAGFFSDEPGFFACEKGFDSYERTLGDEHISIPWDNDMENILSSQMDLPIEEILPALSDNNSFNKEKISFTRYHYMNTITKLYDKNFCTVIGDWCHAHGVKYMGHITEDNNTHSKIGLSAGHFFRSMNGQDYSGCDVVLHQLLPGMENIPHAAFTGFYANSLADGEFYSYALYNMASSKAHIDANKNGRSMCELFGAYGWGEGCKLMKWMADFLIVRGINHFVPHAFSPKSFPDEDCPPHFYAQGLNPQYEGFKTLMQYLNRVSHLISGGHHNAQIAVLYSGDYEWTGGNIMLSQKICKVLAQSQIQYDIISADSLFSGCIVDNEFNLNTQKYKLLIVPYTEYLPSVHNEQLKCLANSGIEIIFADSLPDYCFDEKDCFYDKYKDNAVFTAVETDKLPAFCLSKTTKSLLIGKGKNTQLLQVYEYKHADDTIYIFNNSHPGKTITADITFKKTGNIFEYDAYNEKTFICEKSFDLSLPAYQSRIFISSKNSIEKIKKRPIYKNTHTLKNINWTVSLSDARSYPDFKFYENTNHLINYNQPHKLPNFSGILKYEAEFSFDFDIPNEYAIEFTGVSETLRLWINDEYCGICIAPPYILFPGIKLQKGKNKIIIETRNTLYNELQDIFSRYLPIEATGITGNVSIIF